MDEGFRRMTYYFMPRVAGLESQVTLVNRPSRRTDGDWRGAQTVHVAWSDGACWQIEPIAEFAADADLSVDETMLPGALPDEVLPVLFLSPKSLTGTHDRLPPITHMETVPAWRANIRLCSATTSVGYQGEYPGGMAAANGSLLSLAPLFQTGEGLGNVLLLVNIRSHPAVSPHVLQVHSAATARLLLQATVHSNRCSAIPLDIVEADADGLFVVSCADLTGIPLYLTHTQDYAQMSLEHSHPPVESVVFGARAPVSREMKDAWFARIAG